MKYVIAVFLLSFFPALLFAQIDLDSLRNYLENSNDWIKAGTVDYLSEPFQRYMKNDSLEHYDIFIDSTGQLNEYIGLTAVFQQQDNKNRLVKRIGYNIKGNYYLWDFSPIYKKEYLGDTTIENLFNYKYILVERIITIRDSKNRIIEKARLDQDLNLKFRNLYNYNDSLSELYIVVLNSEDQYILDKFGVAIKWQKFNPSNTKHIVEERFYDEAMNLIDASHNLNISSGYFDCNYSILRREYDDEGGEFITYLNSNGDLECESHNFEIWKITVE